MPNGELQEKDRAKLDAIVQKMVQNNEPEENIKFVVEDFKKKYSSLKKKETTGLPSEQKPESVLLGTPPQKGQKPSVSSGTKGYAKSATYKGGKLVEQGQKAGQEFLTGLPGNEKAEYTVQNNEWRKNVNGNLVRIEDNNAIKYLNKHFKKEVPLYTEEIYTNFPQKEDNQYRIRDNKWQRLVPGAKSWQDISNQGSIDALNNQYGKDVKLSKVEAPKKQEPISTIGNLNEVSFEDKDFVDRFRNLNYYDAKSVVDKRLDMFKKNIYDNDFAGNKEEADKFRASLKNFYNSEAYKIYNEKKSDINKKRSDKLDSLYYELKQSKTDKEKKEVKSRINSYLSEDLIKGQTDAYSMKLNDVNESYKKLKGAIRQFEIDKQNINNISDPNERQMAIDKLNKQAEYLDSRRQEIQNEGSSVVSEMNKLNTLAGKYIIDKEKTGSFGGAVLNKVIKGVSSIIEAPMVIGAELSKDVEFETLSPEKKKYLQDKGYDEDQIKNYLANENLKKSKKDLREGLVSAIGSEGTTEEYAQSKDRGFMAQAIFGLAESLPAMLTPGGAAARFTTMAAQSYSAIEDEMLNDKDFEATSAAERSLVATPYALAMGALENLGVSTVMSKSPLAKSLVLKTISGAAGKIGGQTTKEAFEKIIEKELKSNMAKFGVKVVGSALAEAETGALQSLAGDIVIKKVYNAIKEGVEGNENLKKELTGGEYFETPDTFGEGVKQVLTDAAAEALGGGIMSGTIAGVQKVVNGNLSMYDKEDTKFLKDLIDDDEIKKVFVNDLKTKMLNGTMTKSEAEQNLRNYNKAQSTFKSIPDNVEGEDLLNAVNLIVEKENLTEEIEGKDESLTAAQRARISEINTQLSKISEDATKKSNIAEQEVGTEGGIVQREGVDGGQQEVGQGEGGQRETTQPGTNLGDRLQPGEEEVKPGEKTILSNVEITYPTDEEASQRKAERSTSEYVENTSTNLDEENVDTMKSELEGEFGLLTANNPMAQPLTEEENNQLNEKAKSWLEEKGYKPRKVTGKYGQAENSFFVPNLSKQDAIEFAKEFNQESVAHSDGLIYQDGSMNPRVKAEDNFSFDNYTPESDYVSVVKTPEGLKTFSVGYDFNTKIEPREPIKTKAELQSEVESLGEFLGSTDQEIDQNVERISDKKMAKIVARAAKALSKILPDVRFVVHQTEDSFRKITGEERNQESRGAYVNGTVHINLSKANARTVAHEVFHAILLNKVKTDANAQAVTKQMVQAIANKIEGNKDLKSYLDDFIANYEENIQDEEKLAELVGALAEDYNSFNESIKDLIKRWLDKIADMFGLDPFNRNEVYDMLNTIARKIAKGKVISEEEISNIKQQEKTKEQPSIRKQKAIPTEVSEKLTEDGKGNYVFHHYSKQQRETIKPRSGDNIITGKDEAAALSSVGGAAQYYTMADQVEPGVGPVLHTVVIPKDKVYYLQKDSENFYDQAKKEFEKVRPGQAFNPNYQAAWIAKVANDNGYDMLISNWRNNEFRAQTTKELTPIEGNIDFKERAKEGFKVGDEVMVYGMKAKITSVDGPNLEFKGDGGSGSINFERSPRSITKLIPTTEEVNSEVDSMDKTIKKQKDNTVAKIVKKAKDAGYSDAAIVQYLRNNGYTFRQANNAIIDYNLKAEDVWIADRDTRKDSIKSSLKSFRKKALSARGFLPRSVFRYKELMNASIANQLFLVDKNTDKFSKMYSQYKGDQEQLLKDFDAYLRGNKNVALPQEFKILANSMRNQIDGLSKMLIDSGLVDADMAQTIMDNMGSYLTRSYEVFDNKNWKSKVQEQDNIIQAAKNYLRSQYRSKAEKNAQDTGETVDYELERLVDEEINKIIDRPENSKFFSSAKLGSKDLSVLKERQDIPFEIRALMGEYSDPALTYAKTVLNLANLAAKHNFLSQIRKEGLGTYFFEENDVNRPKDFNTKIAADKSKVMSPLNGLMTTKEIAEAFEKEFNSRDLSPWIKTLIKIQSSVKYYKTIASFATHVKNFLGNIGFLWMNGHVDLKETKNAFNIIRNELFKGSKEDLKNKMSEYIKAGVVNQSAGLNEIRDMFKDANFDIALAKRISNKKVGALGTAKRKVLKFKKGIEDWYQAEDDFFKIIGYEMELSRYADALYGKEKSQLTPDELEEVKKIAVENVKNTYPSYDRIPPAIKFISKSYILGNFISFQAEAYRTLYNTFALAKEELKSDNPKIKKIGAKRLVGASTYLTAKSSLISAVGMAAGTGLTGIIGAFVDDDDEKEKNKDIRKFIPYWSRNSDPIVLSAGDGKIKYIDFSAADPHGGLRKALNAFLNGETIEKKFIDGLIATVEPFLGTEMSVQTVNNLYNNIDKYGNQIWNPEDNAFNKSTAILNYLYSAAEPGTISSIRRGAKAENKIAELAANLTGYRIYDVEVDKQFSFKMADVSDRIKDAKRIYNSKYYNEKATQEEVDKAYDDSQKSLDKIYKEILDNYDSAERLGVDYETLVNSLKEDAGMSKKDINTLLSGELPELEYKQE